MTRSDGSPPLSGVDELSVRRAASGDRAAQEELLRALLPRVRNLVRYLVRGDRDVDDIAQKSLLAILKNLPSFRGDGKFTSWSDRITARETFLHLRRERGEQRSREREAPELYAVSGGADSPDNYVLRRELVKQLDEIPAEQRHAIVLHHVLGMSIPEIARELTVPEDTAKSRLRLGMKKLREKMGREEAV